MTLQLADDRPPIPPADLMLRVMTPFEAQNLEHVRESFDLDALEHLRSFERALACVGRSFADFERLLDFGCGCGRFLRHFGPLADEVEIHGTDIDAEMIEWMRANVTYGRYEVAPHEPPLPYPEHHFDLVINHSVFTHLDERLQDLWLDELQRITRPGAFLLLTVEGQSSWNRTRAASLGAGEDPEPWRSELESRGILFISDDLFVGSTHPDFYHSAVHAPWYIFEHWTGFFDIAAYIPDGSLSQDLIVLRRREDGAPQPRPIGHRAAPATIAAPGSPPVTPPAPSTRLRADSLAVLKRIRRRVRASEPPDPADRDLRAPISSHADSTTMTRELNMLRVGLYEQGQRISVLAAQLRDEIDAVRNGSGGDGNADTARPAASPET